MNGLISLNSSWILNVGQKVYRNLKVSNDVALRNEILLGDIKHRRLMLQK